MTCYFGGFFVVFVWTVMNVNTLPAKIVRKQVEQYYQQLANIFVCLYFLPVGTRVLEILNKRDNEKTNYVATYI